MRCVSDMGGNLNACLQDANAEMPLQSIMHPTAQEEPFQL